MGYKISTIILAIVTALCLTFLIVMSLGSTKFSDSYELAHEIYNNADSYIGKIVTLQGYYSNSRLEEDGTLADTTEDEVVYHFITVVDQYEDCHVSFEFTTKNNEYPAIGDTIEITGVLVEYVEDSINYYTIDADKFTKITASK